MIRAGWRALGWALRDLRMYPLRTVLVGFTLFIGAFAVILISVAGTVSQDIFVAREEMRTGKAPSYAVGIELGLRSTAGLGEAAQRVGRLSGPEVDWTSQIAGSAQARIAPAADTAGAAEDWRPFAIHWVTGDITAVRRFATVAGERFSTTGDSMPLRLALNTPAARELGGPGTVLELVTSANDQPVRAVVTTVVADGDTDGQIYGGLNAILMLAPDLVDSRELRMHVHAPGLSMGAARGLLQDATSDVRGVVTEEVRRVDSVESIRDQLRSLQLAFLVSAVTALVVAAVGIVNIGLASVRERSRELTLRRALGARKRDLAITVLGSTLIVAVVVSLFGIALAAALVSALPGWLPPNEALLTPSMPWAATAIGLLAAMSTALVGSVIPAMVAARQDPANVLRE